MNTKEKLNIYASALKNEKLINIFFYKINKKEPDNFFYYPSYNKWGDKIPSFIEKNVVFLKTFFVFISLITIPLVLLKNIINFLVSISFFKRKSKTRSKTVVFTNSEVNYQALDKTTKENNSYCFISTKNTLPKTSKIQPLYNQTIFFQKVNSFSLSLTFLIYHLSKLNFTTILTAHSAFDFFLLLSYLEEEDPELIITSHHYDRWAILLDKYTSFHSEKTEFKIVQHGIEREDLLKTYFSNIEKIRSPKEVITFNKNQSKIFQKYILDNNPKFIQKHFNTLEIKKNPDIYKFKLLFIGHPIYENTHIEILKKLKKDFDIHYYYKPHPTTILNNKIKNNTWEIINYYPEVDFFISYESTLSYQYFSLGISGHIHYEISTKEDIDLEYKKILSALTSFLPYEEKTNTKS